MNLKVNIPIHYALYTGFFVVITSFVCANNPKCKTWKHRSDRRDPFVQELNQSFAEKGRLNTRLRLPKFP